MRYHAYKYLNELFCTTRRLGSFYSGSFFSKLNQNNHHINCNILSRFANIKYSHKPYIFACKYSSPMLYCYFTPLRVIFFTNIEFYFVYLIYFASVQYGIIMRRQTDGVTFAFIILVRIADSYVQQKKVLLVCGSILSINI